MYSPPVTVGLVVRFVAKPGMEEEFANLLISAFALAIAEDFTPAWLAVRTAPNIFYIVDVFANDEDREKHLNGEIVKFVMPHVDRLLAEPPQFEKSDVLRAKLPG